MRRKQDIRSQHRQENQATCDELHEVRWEAGSAPSRRESWPRGYSTPR